MEWRFNPSGSDISDLDETKMMISLFHSGFPSSNLPISLYPGLRRLAYGSKAHFLNILLYLLGLMPLTYLIVSLRPSMSTNGTGDHNITMVKVSFQEVLEKLHQSSLHSCHNWLLILACSSLCFIKYLLLYFFLAKSAPVLLHDDGSTYEYIRHNKGAGTDITTGRSEARLCDIT